MAGTYRAVMSTKKGGPEALQVVELPIEPPGPGQLRVQVRTAGGVAAEADLRIYFNVRPACAAWLLRVLGQDLNAAGASYQLNLLNHPRSHTRPDAAVLYVPVSAARCHAPS
jgi:hypothetical protein